MSGQTAVASSARIQAILDVQARWCDLKAAIRDHGLWSPEETEARAQWKAASERLEALRTSPYLLVEPKEAA